MARHLAPFSCRQRMAEIVRRRSWGGVLPLGRHASISGSRSIHAPSVSIALSSFQEGQNARHHNQFKLEQALVARIIASASEDLCHLCDRGAFLPDLCYTLSVVHLETIPLRGMLEDAPLLLEKFAAEAAHRCR